jgi:hypothetical protein
MPDPADNQINIRLDVDPSRCSAPGVEAVLTERVLKSFPFVTSVVVLRNDGFSHLMPDETTRRSK